MQAKSGCVFDGSAHLKISPNFTKIHIYIYVYIYILHSRFLSFVKGHRLVAESLFFLKKILTRDRQTRDYVNLYIYRGINFPNTSNIILTYTATSSVLLTITRYIYNTQGNKDTKRFSRFQHDCITLQPSNLTKSITY